MQIKKAALWGLARLFVTGLFLFPVFFVSSGSAGAIQPTSTLSDRPFTFISLGETWTYFDRGGEPDPSWQLSAYDDSAWQSGPAPLGYGGIGEITLIDPGPSPSSRYTTTYFRKTFSVPDPRLVASLTLTLVHSDGVFIYLNGTLVDYPHMGSAGPSYSAHAIACDNGETDVIPIPPSMLSAGQNVLAVEVHTCKPDSQYLILDAGLTGTLYSSPPTATSTPTVTPSLTPNSRSNRGHSEGERLSPGRTDGCLAVFRHRPSSGGQLDGAELR